MGKLALPGSTAAVTVVGPYDGIYYPSRWLDQRVHILTPGVRGGKTTLCGRPFSYSWERRIIEFPIPADDGLVRYEDWQIRQARTCWNITCHACKEKFVEGLT